MDSLKTWIIEVGWKKLAPSLIKGALGAFITYMAAHAGLMEAQGLSYDPSDNTITLQLTKLSAWLVAGGGGLLMAMLTLLQHHTTAAIKGQPQDGAHQRSTDTQ